MVNLQRNDRSPIISIIMPCYNCEMYLDMAIKSILDQTYDNFEFIIVYDPSCDRTLQIIDHFALLDSRIRIIKNPIRLNLCESLNEGIKNANGIYIARMDADDVSLPMRLERQVEYLEENPDCGVVGCFIELWDEQIKRTMGVRRYPVLDRELKKKIFYYSPFAHPSVMIRKSVFNEIGLYNKQYENCEDLELWFRAGEKFKFGNIPEVLFIYRSHSQSVTNKKIRRMEKLSNELRLSNIRNPFFNSGIDSLLYNLLHLLSIYLIPSKFKIVIFNKLRK